VQLICDKCSDNAKNKLAEIKGCSVELYDDQNRFLRTQDDSNNNVMNFIKDRDIYLDITADTMNDKIGIYGFSLEKEKNKKDSGVHDVLRRNSFFLQNNKSNVADLQAFGISVK